MNRFVDLSRSCALLIALAMTSGCVTMEAERDIPVDHAVDAPKERGIYHKAKRGETLWRIAKTYNTTVGEIIRVNNIPKAARIEVNQLLLIPGATQALDIVLDEQLGETEFIWPVQGTVIRFFHERYGNKLNKGIDIKARVGDNVVASRTGRVVFADYLSGYGYTVILDHSDGYHSVYANNSKLLAGLGELALRGTPLARVGQNRELASMHFEIRKKTIEDNPLHYLP